jgi:hypothetical protein
MSELKAVDNTELDTAMEEAETAEVAYTHKFSKPWTWEGKTYEELHFDFDGLTGIDCIKIERELRTKGTNVVAREFDLQYQACYAARACKEGIGSDVVCAMPARDFNKICNMVRSFLLNVG